MRGVRGVLFAVCCISACALDFSISNVFGDNMVLQRNHPVNIYGFGQPAADVSLVFQGTTYGPIRIDNSGVWSIALPAQPATVAPQTIIANCDEGNAVKTVTLSNVLFGDVAICGGQSNMEFTVSNGVPDMEKEIADADNYPLIRVFTVGQSTKSKTPLLDLAKVSQPWTRASAESIGVGRWSAFSAVCWFTYRDVFNALNGTVPMGLISNNWGGTPIQHWVSPDGLNKCGGGTDSVLWNAMIHPYTIAGGFRVRSAIWYQGEANVGQASYYACQMPELISEWRSQIPGLNTFGIVQIAPFTGYPVGPAAADLRQSQLAPLDSLPNIAFAVTTDLVYPYSSPADVHPTNKQPVGQRLSAQILNLEYGFALDAAFPRYSGAAAVASDGKVAVRVTVTGCGAGCVTKPAVIPPGVHANQTAVFMIQTSDSTWLNATYTVDGADIVLEAAAPSGAKAVATSYGLNSYPLAAVFGGNGNPLVGWCYMLDGTPCYDHAQDSDVSPRAVIGALQPGV